MAVAFENLCIALPQHERDEMVRSPSGAKMCGESMTKMVEGKIGNPPLISALSGSAVELKVWHGCKFFGSNIGSFKQSKSQENRAMIDPRSVFLLLPPVPQQ